MLTYADERIRSEYSPRDLLYKVNLIDRGVLDATLVREAMIKATGLVPLETLSCEPGGRYARPTRLGPHFQHDNLPGAITSKRRLRIR